MELHLNPLQRFLVMTVILTVAVILFVNQGGIGWFFDHYQDRLTQQSVIGMLSLFLFLYVFVGGGAAVRIRREQRALRELRNDGQEISAHALDSVLEAVGKCFEIPSERKMKVDPFLDSYDQKIHGPVEALGRSEKLLVRLGLLGTVVGIAMGFSVPDASVLTDADAAQRFSMEALGGIGLALVTTMIGLSGAMVLMLLRSGYEAKVEGMTSDFGIFLESLLLENNVIEDTSEAE